MFSQFKKSAAAPKEGSKVKAKSSIADVCSILKAVKDEESDVGTTESNDTHLLLVPTGLAPDRENNPILEDKNLDFLWLYATEMRKLVIEQSNQLAKLREDVNIIKTQHDLKISELESKKEPANTASTDDVIHANRSSPVTVGGHLVETEAQPIPIHNPTHSTNKFASLITNNISSKGKRTKKIRVSLPGSLFYEFIKPSGDIDQTMLKIVLRDQYNTLWSTEPQLKCNLNVFDGQLVGKKNEFLYAASQCLSCELRIAFSIKSKPTAERNFADLEIRSKDGMFHKIC